MTSPVKTLLGDEWVVCASLWRLSLGGLAMAMQEWFDAKAAKDIDAVMATFHEDFLCVMNEQLLTGYEGGFSTKYGWGRR